MCQLVIHADRRPISEHSRRYNGPTCSKTTVIDPSSENGNFDTQDIRLCRLRKLNANRIEVLSIISGIQRSNDPLYYVLLFQMDLNYDMQSQEFAKGQVEGVTKLFLPCSFHDICSNTRMSLDFF